MSAIRCGIVAGIIGLLVTAQAAAMIEKVTKVEGISEYKLPNGLRVLLFPDPGKATITVAITYLVGSRHENYGETGLAHLLEHMLFRGSSRHRNYNQEMSERGARNNGGTDYDRTSYFETVLASDDNLRWALDLEADRMVGSFLNQKDLDLEKTIVHNEFEIYENYPTGVLEERVLGAAYQYHHYGRSIIGCSADIKQVTRERLVSFYQTYYQPDNAVLLVAGKIDEPKTLALVQKIYGRIPRPKRTLPATYTLEPDQDGERMTVVRRVGDVAWAMAGYRAVSGADPDFAPMVVLSQILGDTPSGRLHKALVETQKAASVFGNAMTMREPGMLLFGAQVRKDASLDEAKELMLKTLESPETLAPTPEEVERAKQQMLTWIELSLTDPDRIGMFLSRFIALGDWRLFFLQRDRLKAVTAADVERVARAYLKPQNRTLGLFIPTEKPDRATIPPPPNVAALVKDYRGQSELAQGEAFDTAPVAIEARTLRFTTPAGLKVALVPKKSRGGNVVLSLALRYGTEQSLMGKAFAAELVPEMLARGTAKHTRQQIADRFDQLKVQHYLYGGVESVGAYLETTRESLPEAFALLAECLREPTFPADQFSLLKQETLAGYEEEFRQPGSIAFNEIGHHLSSPYPKEHPLYNATTAEKIQALKATDLGALKAFHAEFYGASAGELAVVGDFDPQAFEALIRAQLGEWRSKAPYTPLPHQYRPVSAIQKALSTPDKENAFVVLGTTFPVREEDTDYPGLVMADYLLAGGGFINSRFASRIREKEGMSYSVHGFFDVQPKAEVGSWFAFATVPPGQAARVERMFQEEFDRARTAGFTPEEIKAAKSGWIKDRGIGRAQNRELARLLLRTMRGDKTLAYVAELEKNVADLSAEQILAALRKYLDPKNTSTVRAGDFTRLTDQK